MPDEAKPPEVRIAVGHVSALAKVFRFAATLGAAVVLARAFGIDHVGTLGVEAPLSYVWLPFLGLTTIHWYLGMTAIYSFQQVLEVEHDRNVSRDVLPGELLFQEIRSQDTVFLRGLLARTPTPGGRLYRMSWHDPTTLIFVGLCLLGFVAILPWRSIGGQLVWATNTRATAALIVMGILLMGLNWYVGSRWTVALSQVRLPLDQTTAFPLLPLSGPVGNEVWFLAFLVLVVLSLSSIPWVLVSLL